MIKILMCFALAFGAWYAIGYFSLSFLVVKACAALVVGLYSFATIAD